MLWTIIQTLGGGWTAIRIFNDSVASFYANFYAKLDLLQFNWNEIENISSNKGKVLVHTVWPWCKQPFLLYYYIALGVVAPTKAENELLDCLLGVFCRLLTAYYAVTLPNH